MLSKAVLARLLKPLAPIPTGLTPGGRPPRRVAAILFDVYGTLFISASGDSHLLPTAVAANPHVGELLQRHGVEQAPAALAAALADAVDRRHAALRARGVDFPEIVIEELWRDLLPCGDAKSARRFAAEFELLVNPAYPMPHLATTLAAVRRSGRPMGIVSNAQFYTPLLFEWFLGASPGGLGFHPQLTLYSYRCGRAKPSGHLFALAARRLKAFGILPQNALFVGNDMLKDIHPARQAGFMTALFAGDRRSLRLRREEPRCKDLAPDLTVTELNQLTAFIQE